MGQKQHGELIPAVPPGTLGEQKQVYLMVEIRSSGVMAAVEASRCQAETRSDPKSGRERALVIQHACRVSFSAISKLIFSCMLCSIFHDLQDLHTYAPFQIQ